VSAGQPGGPSLRVGLLTPCFWPEVRRGTERFARELGDGLLARGHRPRLITSHRGGPSRRVEDGLPVVRLPRPPDGRLRRRWYEEHLTHAPLSYAVLRTGRYDVAHALYPSDGLAAARWGERTGRPAVLSYMGIPDRAWLCARRARLRVTLDAARRCDAVVALSEAAAREFERTLGIRARVIPPGVDLDAFAPGGERAEAPTIICAAAVDAPHKRVGLLLDAFARVRRQRPDARLVLSRPADGVRPPRGEGIELADLDDRSALAGAYRSAWVSALPSVGEAFGLVLAEALACGTPVVATRAGGMPEVVGENGAVGRLFEGAEPEALASALLEALELAGDPATERACRERAELFSLDRCTESYLALYRELGA
jgi:glycosyltransferase involved in cell wall biosynthesis